MPRPDRAREGHTAPPVRDSRVLLPVGPLPLLPSPPVHYRRNVKNDQFVLHRQFQSLAPDSAVAGR
jgi:hypothetical protein